MVDVFCELDFAPLDWLFLFLFVALTSEMKGHADDSQYYFSECIRAAVFSSSWKEKDWIIHNNIENNAIVIIWFRFEVSLPPNDLCSQDNR